MKMSFVEFIARLPGKIYRVTGLFLVCVIMCLLPIGSVSALDQSDINAIEGGWVNYVPSSGSSCASTGTTSPTGNLDYAGNPILTQGQLQTIHQNESVYQQAGQQGNVPWAMLAVIHLNETDLSLVNPANGNGIYQITNNGKYYPPGPISQQEFLQESVDATQEIHAAASNNYSGDTNISSQTTASSTIKDTLYSYNGRGYASQAAQNGFNPNTQAYEGSPYVMNKADAKRDPQALGPGEQTWGQIKTNSGAITYPANDFFGAFVVYSSLVGATSSSSCSGNINCAVSANATQGLSQVRQNVVCLAEQEYQLWHSGQLTPATGFLKYTQQNYEEWCADFVSWIYDQAHYPLQPDPNWRVPAVSSIVAIGQTNLNFHWHLAGSYTPRLGDLAIHGDHTHVNIVVGVSGTTITLIGGDEGNVTNYGTQHPASQSFVSEDTLVGGGDITSYVSPD